MRVKGRDYAAQEYKLKGFNFPDGFVLISDTREQRPLFTRLPSGLVIKSIALKDGDYSIQGFEDKFAIERKGISDLVSYCASERTRTIQKMERFKDFDFVGLVIEARESDLLKPFEFSKVSPEAIRQTLVSFEIRSGVHIYYSSSRESIGRWVLDRAIKFYNVKREV